MQEESGLWDLAEEVTVRETCPYWESDYGFAEGLLVCIGYQSAAWETKTRDDSNYTEIVTIENAVGDFTWWKDWINHAEKLQDSGGASTDCYQSQWVTYSIESAIGTIVNLKTITP